MLPLILTSAFLAMALAAPNPQKIDLDGVDRIPDPTYTIVPGLESTIVPYNPSTAIAAAAAEMTARPSSSPQKRSNSALVERVACAPEPTSDNIYGINLAPEKFCDDPQIEWLANGHWIPTPSGYSQSFSNLKKASRANGYLGYTKIPEYDIRQCAQECDKLPGCLAFNICEYIPFVPGTC